MTLTCTATMIQAFYYQVSIGVEGGETHIYHISNASSAIEAIRLALQRHTDGKAHVG